MATFVAELKKISEFCNYRDSLSDMLRDHIVCGIRDKAVQRRLLAESDLTYEKALDMAQATEIAKNDSKRFNGPDSGTKPEGIQRVDQPNHHKPHRPSRQNKPDVGKSPSGEQCYRCGDKQCPYKEYDCHFCRKKGHLAKVCKKKLARKPKEYGQAGVGA